MVQTKAVVFTDVERTEIRELTMPDPGPGEVQVRTGYSVISAGTEGWILKGTFTWVPTPYPCVSGYQRVGTITAIGPDVTGWRVGDRVFATLGQWDGAPASWQGAHIAVANTAVDELWRVPDGVDDIDAAAGVVAQVGFNAASRLSIDAGDWVLIFGDGLIGQLASQAARARGARTILVGHRSERMALAAAHSADHVIDDRDEHFLERVRSLTDPKPVAAVIDSVQSEAAQVKYVELLENGHGQIVYCGFTPGKTWADMGLLQQRELTTYFVSGWNRQRMDATLALMAEGRLQVKPLVTHTVAADEAPNMYDMILQRSEPYLGIVLDWNRAA